jgi:hypothetical protein
MTKILQKKKRTVLQYLKVKGHYTIKLLNLKFPYFLYSNQTFIKDVFFHGSTLQKMQMQLACFTLPGSSRPLGLIPEIY